MMRRRTMTTGLALLLIVITAVPVLAQKAPYRVDGDRIKSYIEHICTDEFKGRQSCTPEFARAADWVAAKFQEWGLEPAGENGTYFQTVPIRDLTWYDGVPSLSVSGTAFDVLEGDFTLLGQSTVATRVNAEVVFAGYGVSAPGKGLDEYAGLDVRGKVVLVLRGDPTDLPRAGGGRGGSMAPEARAEAPPEVDFSAESQDAAKIRTAYGKGAAAILLYEPDAETTTARFMGGGGGRRGEQEAFTPERDFLAFSITARVFNKIMRTDPQESIGGLGRRLNTYRQEIQYLKPASFAIGSRVQLTGYDAATVYSEANGNNTAHNVIAKITGTDRRLRSEYVITGGHLDHLGVRNGLVYNGADDNATGSCTVMEIARAFAEGGFRPRRTLIFCAWCGEELGLIGSNYYVANPCDGVTMDQVVTYINMDMVGLGTQIGAPGALNFPSIWEVIIRDQDQDVLEALVPSTGGSGGSDHSAFINLGIEAMALMTRGGVGHPDYHQPEDDTWKIDPEILRKTGQFVLQGMFNLAGERHVQLLIPNRLNIFNAVMLQLQSFNPGIEGNRYTTVALNFPGKDAMMAAILDSARVAVTRAREQAAGAGQQQAMMRMYMGGGGGAPGRGRSVYRGIDNLSLFAGDVALLDAASEFLGFGRVDISGDDGTWVRGGRLTPAGRQALQVMEEKGIAVHMKSPSATLLQSILDAAARPFIVSGSYKIGAAQVAKINETGVLLTVTMDPANITACIAELERLKALLGDTDNLVLSITDESNLDTAKQALYLGLIEKGWTHEEIAGARRGQGGIAGGNLGRLGGGAGGAMRIPRG